MSRLEELQRLRDAASVYAEATRALLETAGMGPAHLHCMAWEERARRELKAAITAGELSGLIEDDLVPQGRADG